ncbi:ABC transporter substrate-binding protein [Paracraurococcus lichenis]|uniref:Extracellular solute-binding protein n=1 Tax=Paracraurococcus lichenis TaxID=3064888 RepID=A0ABT9E7C3_9PROT|nr:extracellular solute-binding protein [Paracraurococcus sp. LOR1-02]MDO9711965.1 extracellular solute-binding protein [Paracraurococcus sp. LOR1-02]
MTRYGMTRRAALRLGVAGAALPVVHVHAQGTAGVLRCGFWEHWVPAGNDIIRELCEEWGAKNRMEVRIDRLVSAGNQILLTIASQAQSRSGHDIIAMPTWSPGEHARLLEPVDDVVARLQKKYGAIVPAAEYLAKREGAWRAVPAIAGTQTKPPCIRYDLFEQHAGIDIRAMWPARPEQGPGAETWNWDTFLVAAEKCANAGYPFALPMGQYSDAVDWVGAMFRSFGASMMDDEGRVTVRGNAKLRQAVDYTLRLTKFLPRDVWAWDDASNNRALIAGKTALAFNPPSAWAVAKRDAPQVAEKCWYAPFPAGPVGRFTPYLPYFWGIWSFSRQKTAAKSLLEFLSDRSSAERQATTTNGYDIPPFQSMSDFRVWETEGPPTGFAYNYPDKPHQKGSLTVAFAPAPAEIAVQAYVQAINTKLIARIAEGGQSTDQALAWAEGELRNFAKG